MSWATKTHTFSPSTVAKSSEVNDNFDDMVDQLNIAMPSGAIVIWSGSVASIPSGFYLTDGNNSTPDLRGKFIPCAGGAYAVGDTGGENTHVLTESEMPAHTHTIGHVAGDQDGSGSNGSISGSGVTGSTGGGAAHENRPPYYALAYMMKS